MCIICFLKDGGWMGCFKELQQHCEVGTCIYNDYYVSVVAVFKE
jgi:hypothetical protein